MSPEVLYLDTDSEITEAIDKLKAAHGKEVRLVAPARSTILQSAVNLKLLKKAAKDHKKELVLVTTDKTSVGLAGMFGLAVASSVKAGSEVPEAPEKTLTSDKPIEISQEDSEPGHATAAEDSPDSDAQPATDDPVVNRKRLSAHDKSEPAATGGKKLKVPNFGGLNKKIWIGLGVVALIIVLILAYIFLPTGKVTLTAKANKMPVSFQLTADSGTGQSNYAAGQIAAQKIELDKDLTASYQATGQKDAGTKATGGVKFSNASNSNPITIPAGTTLSASGKNFTLDQTVTVPGATVAGGIVPGTANGNITATQNGDSYNLGTTSFVVSGFSSGTNSVSASGSTSGGISKTVTVVAASDIENAKKTMLSQAEAANKQELLGKVTNQQTVLGDSYQATVVSAQPSAVEGAEASSGTLTAKVSYTVFAANNKDLNALFDAEVQAKVPPGSQVYQNGVGDAKYSAIKFVSPTKVQATATTGAFYGNQINTTQVAKDAAGKAKHDVSDKVKAQYPQATSVQVETNPALDPNMPFFSGRINVQIKVDTSE